MKVDRIVVAEHPKSGGYWFVSLIGDTLSLPKRDIYIKEGFSDFSVSRFPWFEGEETIGLTDACVIKSHELPGSHLHDFPARFIHLIRDGRDVVVSKYFFEKDFCVKNNILDDFNLSFDEYVIRVAHEWRDFVLAWIEVENVITCRYEALLHNTFASLQGVLSELGAETNEANINASIEKNTRENMRKGLGKTFKHNTFVRKGVSGDWNNYFSEQNKDSFKEVAGDLLIKLGYEKGMDW